MTIYKTHIQQRRFNGQLFVLETIRDLDEAIDQLCEELGETSDPFAEDLCPYFGILWQASVGLSQFLSDHPELIKNKTVLELGCGLGLPSMVAASLGGRVLASDYHPDVESYLQRNCRHSNLPPLEYQRFNWREERLNIGPFDVVMGSDILYESKHPAEVAQGLIRYVKSDGVIILADQGRNYLGNFIKAMDTAGLKSEQASITVEDKEIKIFCFRI